VAVTVGSDTTKRVLQVDSDGRITLRLDLSRTGQATVELSR